MKTWGNILLWISCTYLVIDLVYWMNVKADELILNPLFHPIHYLYGLLQCLSTPVTWLAIPLALGGLILKIKGE